MKNIDTEKFSAHLRGKAIDLDRKAILMTNFSASKQETDLTVPANCNGFGRIRHFKLEVGEGWPKNPLPILPALKVLGLSNSSEIRAQVFQNSACNWRCWYCYVDFDLLNADKKHASFLTCDEMIDLYQNQENPPSVIDLTGGQPDLTPEWIPWMMQTLIDRKLDEKVYLWSDDNLSNDYFWKFLTDEQIDLISECKMYSRVCCFKGIDDLSFSLNTKAEPGLFSNQFSLAKRLLDLKLDLYFYITLTALSNSKFDVIVPRFFDEVQKIHEKLPLRIVPLQIFEYAPMESRMNDTCYDMINGQALAIKYWIEELEKRFRPEELGMPITEINIKS